MTTSTTSASVDDDSSTVASKDITNLIQITNEHEEKIAATVEESSEHETIHALDCLFGSPSFCPIGTAGDTDESSSSEDNNVDVVENLRKAMDGATQSVRGALTVHVVPRIDELKGALDEHVSPRVASMKRTSLETIDLAKEHSQTALKTVQAESQKMLENVQETSTTTCLSIKEQSQQFVDSSKRSIEEFQDKVRPACERLVEATTDTYAPYYLGTAPSFSLLFRCNYWLLLEATLRGFGRVVFCDNPVTGFWIWLGILVASPLAGLSSLLVASTTNATALFFEADKEILRKGGYAKNAVLVGTFLADSLVLDLPETGNQHFGAPIVLFLGVALAPWVVFLEWHWTKCLPTVPSLLMPSNLLILGVLLCAKAWNLAMETTVEFEGPYTVVVNDSDQYSFVGSVFHSFPRIFLVGGSVWSAACILLGVLLCSRYLAASLVGGALLSTLLLAEIFGLSHAYLMAGYAGFNAALVAAGITYWLVPSYKVLLLGVFGVVATVVVQATVDVLLDILGMSVGTTLGFCLTVLPLLATDSTMILQHIPESELSIPEDHFDKGEDAKIVAESDSTEDDESDGDVDVDVEAPPPTNESTPLLS